MLYQTTDQIDGTNAHKAVDQGTYSTSSDILCGIDVYSEKYGLVGKIDIYDRKRKILRERKRQIKNLYDGYIFQIYAQYFSMIEMGYEVGRLELYSMVDNKTYDILLPEKNADMRIKFERLIADIHGFSLEKFEQTNKAKCVRCIYEPACDRSIL